MENSLWLPHRAVAWQVGGMGLVGWEGGWAVGLKFPLLAILCHGTRFTKSYRGNSYDDHTNHSFVGSGFLGKPGRCVIK